MDINGLIVEKKAPICFYIFNQVIMIPYLVKNFSWINLAIYIVLMFTLAAYIFIGEEGNVSVRASMSLPYFVGFDVLSIFSFFVAESNTPIKEASIEYAKSNVWLLIAGIIILIVMLCTNAFLSNYPIALGISWAIYTVGIKYIYSLNTLFLIVVFFTIFIWTLILKISLLCANMAETKARLALINCIVSIIMILLVAVYRPLLEQLLNGLVKNFYIMLEEGFRGHYITFLIILAVVMAVAMFSIKNNGDRINSIVFLAIAGFICMLKLWTKYYFTYNVLFVILYLIITVAFVSLECNKKKGYLEYIGVSLIWMLCMYCMYLGIWLFAIAIAGSFLFILFKQKSKYIWLYAIICMAAIASSWVYHMRNSADNFAVIIYIACFCIITILLLSIKHPAGMNTHWGMFLAVCMSCAVLLIIPCAKGGVAIDIKQSINKSKVSVSVSARGSENSVKEVYYYLANTNGEIISENIEFKDSVNVDIENAEYMKTVAVDENGRRTERKVWNPLWMDKISEIENN